MSALARTALRLAGIEALKADPVIAALCGGRVFDSRIEDLDQSEPVPVLVVLTEEMEGTAFSANNGGPPFDDSCELVIEIAMRAAVQAEDGTPAIATPETDAELEAQLDLLEQRAVDAICVADTAESLLVRQAVTRRVEKQRSARFVEAETGVKLAIRQLRLSTYLKGEDQRDLTVVADPQVSAAPHAGNTGNGALTLIDPASDETILTGQYTVALTGPSSFTVTDPNGAPVGVGEVGRGFIEGAHFFLAAGSTPFSAGDSFVITVTPGPYAMLPEPLRSVANAMAPNSTGKSICDQIAAALSPETAPHFTGADVTFAPAIELDPTLPPIPAGQPGSNPTFGDTVEIP